MAAAAAALAGLSFLVIGESHMLYELRDSIHADLSAQGAAYVHSIGACGASAIDWVKPRQVDCGQEKKGQESANINTTGMQTQSIKQLISSDKPDVVVLIIGDTMGSYDNDTFPKAWAWQGVSTLTKEIASTGTACVWVGPAYGRAGGKYNKRDDRSSESTGSWPPTSVPASTSIRSSSPSPGSGAPSMASTLRRTAMRPGAKPLWAK